MSVSCRPAARCPRAARVPSGLESSLAAAAERFDQHLARVRRWVQQPSISATGEGMAEMAALVRAEIAGLGGDSEVVATDGWPIVLGQIDAGAARTLLVYGMYDVQPVAGETWRVPPFAGDVIELEGLGPSLVARGVYNSKGPLAGVLAAVASIRAGGQQLPVNLKLVVEGEEELASAHLGSFLRARRERLSADATFAPFYTQNRAGVPTLKLGNKGVLFFELHCRGGAWGGPTKDGIHGAEGAWVASPAWKLVQVLGTMVGPDERITVPGLLDQVASPSDEDERLLRALDGRFDARVVLEQQRVQRFKHDQTGVELLRHHVFDPIINLDGLKAGHTDEGSKALLPDHAFAKCSLRLVPKMSIDACKRALTDHVARVSAGAVTIRFGAGYPCARTPIDAPIIQAFLAAAKACGTDPECWPYHAGSGPACLFNEILGQPLLLGGLGHGGRQHAPDEYATLAGMKLHEEVVVRLLYGMS
jgi:acetylornithine deacetylase/succinyl-diaminopimelate desuccinylase-like protein